MASTSYRQLLHPENVEISTILDHRIAEMRRMLADMKPSSAATALRVLREAFPEATLADRVRALTPVRH
jgi:hypothetical protein